jgi:hypothetical protein
MGIFDLILNAFGRNPDDDAFKKGEKFENYTESFFPASHYGLVEKTHDSKTNKKRFIESSLKPDFKFRDKKTNKCFYVEAKYRSRMVNGKIEWCKSIDQLRRYQEYNNECPVFILIGYEGKPSRPHFVFLIPLTAAKYTSLYFEILEPYRIKFEGAVISRELWNR